MPKINRDDHETRRRVFDYVVLHTLRIISADGADWRYRTHPATLLAGRLAPRNLTRMNCVEVWKSLTPAGVLNGWGYAQWNQSLVRALLDEIREVNNRSACPWTKTRWIGEMQLLADRWGIDWNAAYEPAKAWILEMRRQGVAA